jgi:hypothetical protein
MPAYRKPVVALAILVNCTEDAVLHAAYCDVLAVRLR